MEVSESVTGQIEDLAKDTEALVRLLCNGSDDPLKLSLDLTMMSLLDQIRSLATNYDGGSGNPAYMNFLSESLDKILVHYGERQTLQFASGNSNRGSGQGSGAATQNGGAATHGIQMSGTD